MNPILKAWNASFVRRWHTHPQLCDSVDYDSGHQQRCALLMLSFWPDSSRNAIVAALLHDQGECDAGDMAHPAKKRHPEIRELLHAVEMDGIAAQGFTYPNLSTVETARLSFCDLLDSYVWMLRHKPILARKVEWMNQHQKLYDDSLTLGIAGAYDQFMMSVESEYAL